MCSSALRFSRPTKKRRAVINTGPNADAFIPLVYSQIRFKKTLETCNQKKICNRAQQRLKRMSHQVQPIETLHVITADPTDNRILECAAAAKANYIVSGDKHLLGLKSFQSIPVLRVADFMNWLQAQ